MEGKDVVGTRFRAGCVHVCEGVVVHMCVMGV